MRKLAPFILFIVVVILYTMVVPRLGFGYIDDAFISFRYAKNFADGHGLVYNLGERVEGYSNPLFVFLMAAFAKGGIPPHVSAGLLGIFFHALTVALMLVFLRRTLSEPVTRPLPIFAMSFLLLHPALVAYSVAGMEATMAAFWLLLAVYLVHLGVERGRASVLAALAGLATVALALSRPEGVAMAAPLGLWLLLGNKRGRWLRPIIYSLVVIAGYGAFLLWRHGYYGDWQPNTYYAKAYGAGFTLLKMGMDYLWRFTSVTLLPYLLLPLLILLISFRVRMPAWWLGTGATVLTYLAVIAYLGGDHFPLSRFLVPVIPLMLALIAESGRRMRDAVNAHYPNFAQLKARPAAWVFVWIFLFLSVFFGMFFRNEGFIFIGQVRSAEVWCGIGKNLAKTFPPDTTMGLIPIGAIGYCSEMPIVDMVGLTDAHIAHAKTDLSRSMAGHGRYDNDYLLNVKKPKLILALIDYAPFPVPEWLIRKGVLHLASRDLVTRRQFIDDYAFHRVEWGKETYFHYWSRRDFEDSDTHSGAFPVEGVESPIPEFEPLVGDTLREKVLGEGAQVEDRQDELPENWEVW